MFLTLNLVGDFFDKTRRQREKKKLKKRGSRKRRDEFFGLRLFGILAFALGTWLRFSMLDFSGSGGVRRCRAYRCLPCPHIVKSANPAGSCKFLTLASRTGNKDPHTCICMFVGSTFEHWLSLKPKDSPHNECWLWLWRTCSVHGHGGYNIEYVFEPAMVRQPNEK